MNSTIILDFQTGASSPYYKDCIARENCKIRKKVKRQKVAEATTELLELAVAVPLALPKK